MFEPHLNERQPRVDRQLIIALFGLMCIGVAFIYSAKPPTESASLFGSYFMKQMVWYAVGTVVAVIVAIIDYRSVARWALLGYWTTILLLVAVLLVGKTVYGARRWIDLGLFDLQPSEFAKLGLIFFLAHFLSRPAEELKTPNVFFKAVGMTILPFVLILREPDLGSALVLLPIAMAMMFVAGVPSRYLLRLVGGGGLLVALLLVDILFAPPNWQIKLAPYQRHRLLVFFGRDFAPANSTPDERRRARQLQDAKTYQIKQAMISVGAGGLTGKGWRQGQQIALGFLPPGASHNDFIFSVIAEEKGFLGSMTVLLLYAVVLFAGIRIAGEARDRLGKLLAVGVVALLFSHIFVNIGMNIRLMPVTGIPLPLLSYGGSSVLCSLIAAGILQNVYIHRNSY